VFRIVVNHDTWSPLYGDVWMGGSHATFAVLLANAAARGWTDRTAGWEPAYWQHAKDVWEHLHPSILSSLGHLLLGEGWALSLDPRDGRPWGSNGIRTAFVEGYSGDLGGKNRWGMGPWSGTHPYLDLWPDEGDEWSGPTNDHVRSMSHCQDGTLWIGSLTHGLARIDPDGGISYPPLPDPALHGDSVSAVACDPSDGSLWIGLGRGGVLRRHADGTFELLAAPAAVSWRGQPVQSIQIDRWSSPRVVYFAFQATRDAAGAVLAGGGVAAYDGP
jgi:hypothetical protein